MILDENINQEQHVEELTDKETFKRIWLEPKKVFNFLEKKKYDQHVTIMLAAAGIASGINQMSEQTYDSFIFFLLALILSVVLGGMFGVIFSYIVSAVVSWTGKLFNGKAGVSSILRVSAYSSIPGIVSMIYLIPFIFGLFATGHQGGFSFTDSASISLFVVIYGVAIFNFILGIWSFVLYLIGISVAHKFDLVRAFITIIISMFLIVLPFGIIAFIFGDLMFN